MKAFRIAPLFTICSVLALAPLAAAQVRLLEVGEARAGRLPDTARANPGRASPGLPAVPDWLTPVPVRTAFERAMFPWRYPELSRALVASALIPGLAGPCTPQGVASLPDGGVAITYHVEHPEAAGPAGAVLAILDPATGAIRAVRELQDPTGKPLDLHVGGVAASGGYLFTGGSGRVLRFPLPAGQSRWLKADREWNVDATASFMSVSAGTLWVGDFYRDGDKPAGRGWAAGYTLDLGGAAPVAYVTYTRDGRLVLRPDAVIDLPTQVQGFAVCGDRVALSRSHGSQDGELELWQSPLTGAPRPVTLPGGVTTNGWSLTRKHRVVRVPSGTEDLEWQPPHLLIAFESGSAAYRDDWRAKGGVVDDRFMFLTLP